MEEYNNWFMLHKNAAVGGVKDGEGVRKCPICGTIGLFELCCSKKCLDEYTKPKQQSNER